MKNMKYHALIILGVFFSVIICAALFFSYRAYVAANRIEKDFKQSIGMLEQEVNRLKAQLATARNRTEDSSAQRYTKTGNAVTAGSKKDAVVKEREAVRRLEKIVESTGLEQLAANQTMDPTILSEIYDEYAERKQVVQRHEQQLEKNREFRKADADQYGEELMALYERARLRRGGGVDRQESDSAFAELIAKYPEAYATGMAIAERALVSGFRRNTPEVEKYYDMLRDNENFSHIVTDRGVEAMPNIEYNLARQYLRQGNSDDALALIESLEKNYPDSLLFTRRSGSGRRWQPVSQVVSNLRQELELTR
jgi:tetratricopeptide (TPR) repeat protein